MKQTRARLPPTVVPDCLCWTIEEAALACAVTPLQITKAIRAGDLRVCRISKQTIRILPEEAHRWLLKCTQPGAKFQVDEIPDQKEKEPPPFESNGLEDLDWVLDS